MYQNSVAQDTDTWTLTDTYGEEFIGRDQSLK
jgi:hypothetical protein